MSAKIQKPKGVSPNELELEVAKAISDIEVAPGNELRGDLRDFSFSAAKEIEVSAGGKGNKSAIVIFVPFRTWRESGKITKNGRLVRELEKKFQKKHVILVANRTIMDKNFRRKAGGKGQAVRPRKMTLTAVHESILEDIISPSEIVGKRTRVTQDGNKLIKIFLDQKDKDTVGEKLNVFSAVYRQLTNKDAVFSFE